MAYRKKVLIELKVWDIAKNLWDFLYACRELSQQVCEEISLEQQQLLEKMIQEKKLFEEKKKAEAAALQKQKEQEVKRLAEVQKRLAEQREQEERTKRVTDEIVQEILETYLEDEVKQISNEQMEYVLFRFFVSYFSWWIPILLPYLMTLDDKNLAKEVTLSLNVKLRHLDKLLFTTVFCRVFSEHSLLK